MVVLINVYIEGSRNDTRFDPMISDQLDHKTHLNRYRSECVLESIEVLAKQQDEGRARERQGPSTSGNKSRSR